MSAPTRPRPRRWLHRFAWAWILVGLPLSVLGLTAYRQLMPGALFLSRMTDARPEADYYGGPFEEAEQTLDLASFRLRIRTFVPPSPRRVVLFVHGVHHKGMDEPRIVSVARKLAGIGVAVVTPMIEPLAEAEVTPQAAEEIERAALWLLDESGLVPAGEPIGLMGICFGGGLTIAAAGRPALRDRTAFAFAIGAHAELRDVLRYLSSGRIGDRAHTPDPYGTAAVLKQAADRIVPADQAPALRALLDRFLRDGEQSALDHLGELPPRSRELARQAIKGELDKLGPVLLAHIDSYPLDPRLSPGAGPPPRCPVFLLHAAGDRVIPREHAARLASAWPGTPVEVLVTPLFEHVDIQAGASVEKLALAAFITRMLRS